MNKRKILESAQKHLQRGALDKALEDYQTLLKADSKDSNIRLKVGDLHLKLGRTSEAIDAYLRVAQQFTNEGFDAKAVALYKQVTKLDEKRFEVHAQLGELYQRMGLTSEAMRAIQFAADGAHRAGDKSQALGLLRRMAALDPTNTTSRLKVADLLRAEGKVDDALAEYDEVVRELERQKNAEGQIKVLERALELAPARASTLRALAQAALETGAKQQAEKAARSLVAAMPDDVAALELLGTVLERIGRDEEAAETFRGLAEIFRARGDEDRARALTQRYGAGAAFEAGDSGPLALEGDPTDLEIDPDLDASLGLVDAVEDESAEPPASDEPDELGESSDSTLQPSGDLAEEIAPAGDSDSDADFDQLLAEASVFSRYGKHERAIETLRSALRVEPGNAAALEKLGESLVAIGNKPHASSALARAGAAYGDAGNAEGVERVRRLLAPLDARAASALAAPPASEPATDALADLDSGDVDIEIDAGDHDSLAGPEPSAAPDPAASAADDDFSGIDIDVSGDLADAPAEESPLRENAAPASTPSDDEGEFSFDDRADGAKTEAPPAKPAVATPAHPAQGAASSVQADLEEAEFYREQGLLEEARALYARVLAAKPGHPVAQAKLAEVEAASAASLDLDLPATSAQSPAAAEEADSLSDLTTPEYAAPVASPIAPPAPATPQAAPRAAQPAPVAAREEAPPEMLGGADFDLAAELSGAFDEPGAARTASGNSDGDGFAEVFAAFKAGVKREVEDGDYEAHFDLGIAYKEMGLLEDAIGEFRVAHGDPGRSLACLHLMGVCALDLGRAGDAIAHLSEALARGQLPAEQEAALRVDLGRAYQGNGDRARARREFEAARGVDPSFGDIDRLLAELAAAPPAPADGGETFESFDDFVGDHGSEPPRVAPAASYESFDELVTGEDSDAIQSAPAEAEVLDLQDEVVEDESEPSAPPEPPPRRATRAPEPPPDPPKPAPPSAPAAPQGPGSPGAPRRKKKISFV
ncbi:MAG TPA: tetratricopeptide repeat protein [Myxococcota bacterium]